MMDADPGVGVLGGDAAKPETAGLCIPESSFPIPSFSPCRLLPDAVGRFIVAVPRFRMMAYCSGQVPRLFRNVLSYDLSLLMIRQFPAFSTPTHPLGTVLYVPINLLLNGCCEANNDTE